MPGDVDTIDDAACEALAALSDLRERIEAGHDAKQVIADVWDSYEIDDANAVYDEYDPPGPFPRGVYLLADTPTAAHPLATEADDGDHGLLREALAEEGFVVVDEDTATQIATELRANEQLVYADRAGPNAPPIDESDAFVLARLIDPDHDDHAPTE